MIRQLLITGSMIAVITSGCGQGRDSRTGINARKSEIVESAPEITGMSFIRGSEFSFNLFNESKEMLINSFYLDQHPVTIAEFAEFVAVTGYIPLSDRPETETLYLQEMDSTASELQLYFHTAALARTEDNTWRHDERGNLRDSADWHSYPVVYVSLDDARAYARWKGKRLPNMYEWQYAAIAGLDSGEKLRWIEENAWHAGNTKVIMPVGLKSPNSFGVHDLSGNINELVEQTDYRFNHEEVPDSSRISVYALSSFTNNPDRLYSPSFFFAARGIPSYEIGFRCAMDIPIQK